MTIPKQPTLLWLFLAMFACSPSSYSESSLGDRVRAIIDAPEYQHSHWGILVKNLDSGTILFEHNAHKLFMPASVTKLFSTAAALDAYGPAHTFETPVYALGDIEDGKLRGDLLLVAQGDLTLGSRTTNNQIRFKDVDHTYANFSPNAEMLKMNPLAGLNSLARQVAAANIREITGDILIDDRLFEGTESSGSGPAWVTPIMLNDNLVDIEVTPRSEGKLARINWRPRIRKYQVDAQVMTIAADKEPKITLRTEGEGKIVVRGTIPAGHKPVLKIQEIYDPRDFTRAAFIEALQRAGVRVQASSLASHSSKELPFPAELAHAKKLASLTSPPFSEQIKLVLKVSHNLHASALPLLLAVKHDQRTLSEGLQAQGRFLQGIGIDKLSVSFAGGAGGARADFVTPAAAVKLLEYLHTTPHAAIYREALPVLGIDGTLATVVPADHPARGKIFAKTGTFNWTDLLDKSYLLNSKALAGYIQTARGGHLAFAMFVNSTPYQENLDAAAVGKTLGKLAAVFYDAP